MNKIQHLVGGVAMASTSGRTGPVYDPATGEQTGTVALASVPEVDAAVDSASAAFAEWGEVSLARRTKLMLDFRNLVVEHADDL
ncbi:MAG: aldehyde dehydrogenase family protein, partial [Actinomycetota bacterium]|nr:aldehyde dehydrogenase family protein [Actinomycetota bacterium]